MKLTLVRPKLGYGHGSDNFSAIRRALAPVAAGLGPEDIVLLPEHWD
jgi:hypothetical protein